MPTTSARKPSCASDLTLHQLPLRPGAVWADRARRAPPEIRTSSRRRSRKPKSEITSRWERIGRHTIEISCDRVDRFVPCVALTYALDIGCGSNSNRRPALIQRTFAGKPRNSTKVRSSLLTAGCRSSLHSISPGVGGTEERGETTNRSAMT